MRNLAMKSKIIRSTYIYDPWSSEATFSRLKIEVNINETQSLYPLVPMAVQVPDGVGGARTVTVHSYDLDEMLGTKMRALLQREHGRDLSIFGARGSTASPLRLCPSTRSELVKPFAST